MFQLGQTLKNKDGKTTGTIEKVCGVDRLVLRDGDRIKKTITLKKIDTKEWEVVE